MAAKRSPILGYNHNVRFRGIVFHIQTEDSGIINPHVFTHLFHGGVIISTRKLVYDPDANDEAVKALMQAQHKAVMKDLKRGTFDDKIDQYLGGTEGLLPRESAISVAAPRPVPAAGDEPVDPAPIAAAVAEPTVAPPAGAADATPQLEIIDALSEPIELPLKVRPPAPEPAPELELPAPALDLPAPAMVDDAPSAEIEILGAYAYADNAPEDLPVGDATIPIPTMPEFAPRRIGDTAPAPIRSGTTPPPVRVAFAATDAARAPTEQVPPAVAAALDVDAGGVASHKNDVSAAMRAIQVTDEELSAAGLSEMAEIHSPAPPSAPAPPGAQPERAGSYHLGRKTGVVEAARPPIPRPAPTPAPARPPLTRPTPPPVPTRTATPVGSRVPTPNPSPSRGMPAIPQRAGTQPRTGAPPRPPTPPANPVPRPSTAPGSGPSRGRPASGGGVVVSRPAVIVGGKGAPTTPPAKPRRAREADGFGGDLISERSLDEVILAYLSEDTNDE